MISLYFVRSLVLVCDVVQNRVEEEKEEEEEEVLQMLHAVSLRVRYSIDLQLYVTRTH